MENHFIFMNYSLSRKRMAEHLSRILWPHPNVKLSSQLQKSRVLAMIVILLALLVHEGTSSRLPLHQHGSTRPVLCPRLEQPRHGTISCLHQGLRVPCREKMDAGTVADYECDTHFIAEPTRIIQCLGNGTWDSRVPKCMPDCGKQNSAVSLITNGIVAFPGIFPWQVAIYNHFDDGYEFWCGGSLISEFSVVTAAHCTWKVQARDLVVVFGKLYRDFNADEENTQKIRAIRVEMLQSYQDVGGNYNGDLSILFLERAVILNAVIRPICIDWKQELVDVQLVEGNLGTALGWGLTENDSFSEVLKYIQLPVKSDRNCIAQQHRDFRKFVTYTSFCAGLGNGSGVCNGDSGGGLAFLDKKSDAWYLQGVISVSPRRKGTSFCDPNYFTVFTKVTVFVKWLLKMKELEEELVLSGQIQSNAEDVSSSANEIPFDVYPKIDFILNKKLENMKILSDTKKNRSG